MVDSKWGIGRNGQLLFHLPKDMRFFREQTSGGVVIMGRRTFESLPNRKSLKDRVNIVLTSNPVDVEGVISCKSYRDLAIAIQDYEPSKVWLIGGASIYDQLYRCCTDALVTRVSANGNADTFAPDLSYRLDWEFTPVSGTLEDNGYVIQFTKYTNKAIQPLCSMIDGGYTLGKMQ